MDIVCELMGGTDRAHELTLTAFRNGKLSLPKIKRSYVTTEPLSAAREIVAHYLFEASVAGGIPVIKALIEGLVI